MKRNRSDEEKLQNEPEIVPKKKRTESVDDRLDENVTNQEQAKGKVKAHVYTDEDHYYEQEAFQQTLWKEDERERRRQQIIEEHWKEVRSLKKLEKKWIYECETAGQTYESDDSEKETYDYDDAHLAIIRMQDSR